MGALDSLKRERERVWAGIYANRQQQFSVATGTGAVADSGTIVNFGDRNAGKLDATTFTGMQFNASGIAPVWTPSAALSAFATAFDLTNPANWQGYAPVLTFNGTSDEMDTPDAANWSRAAGAFSVGGWYNFTDATSTSLLCKFTTTGDLREWRLITTAADKLQFILSDENDATTPNATLDTLADTAIVQGQWLFLVATYDGTANATGIGLYSQGAVSASTDTDDANFASLRDTTSVVELGDTEGANFFEGKMAGGPFGPFYVRTQLTAAQVYNLYARERLALGV